MTEPSPTPPQPESKDKTRRRPGCLFKLIITAFSFLFALVLGEIAVRVLGDEVLPNPIGPRYMYVNDDVMGVDQNPGFRGRFALYDEFDVAVEISSQGYRDREFGPKRPGVKRIISLGDSFAFGFGVRAEDTYAKVLERRLNGGSDGDRKFEVLNAGASGRGILEMIEVLKRAGTWFAPDVVIASFFYVNDLQDIESFPQHVVRGGVVLTPYFGKRVDESPWLQFCFGYSNLALLIEIAKFNMATGAGLGTVPQPGQGSGDMRPVLLRADPTNADEVKWFEHQQELWPLFEPNLVKLEAETNRLGAKLVLITIPQEFQTRDEAWAEMTATRTRSSTDYDRFLIGKKVSAIAERAGVTFLDLVPGFRATKPDTPRFFPINKHFNEAGHAFTAELIADFLRARGLL